MVKGIPAVLSFSYDAVIMQAFPINICYFVVMMLITEDAEQTCTFDV